MPRTPWNPFVVTVRKPRRRRRGSVQRTGGMSERKKAYLAFIKSPAWRAYRAAWWAEYDRRNPVRVCYCCGVAQTELKRSLELHHRTYERLGREEWDDLCPVCQKCHQVITRMWRNRSRTGMTMTLWELTDWHRDQMKRYQALQRGKASGR